MTHKREQKNFFRCFSFCKKLSETCRKEEKSTHNHSLVCWNKQHQFPFSYTPIWILSIYAQFYHRFRIPSGITRFFFCNDFKLNRVNNVLLLLCVVRRRNFFHSHFFYIFFCFAHCTNNKCREQCLKNVGKSNCKNFKRFSSFKSEKCLMNVYLL